MVRFVNAVVDSPQFRASVGDAMVGDAIGYRQFGEWVQVTSGSQDVTLRIGEGVELTDTFDFQPNQHYWVIAWGALNAQGHEVPASLFIAPEESFSPSSEDTWMRVGNFVADGEAYGMVITTDGGWNLLFPNQPQGTMSEYKLGPIYENTFDIIPARDTSLDAVIDFDRNIQIGILYTFIITGRASNGTLEVFHIAESAAR